MINLLNGLFDYQENCVNYLLEKTSDSRSEQTIIVKSPTGSGKTIILLDYIDKFIDNYDSNTCFVWLSPGEGELEEQSQSKMNKLLPTRTTYDIEDVLLNGFSPGTTTFINWQKVTKKGNKSITESEKTNLYERIASAHRRKINFIILIDEEHRNNTLKAQDIIDAFAAKNIIRVSATAKRKRNAEWYDIEETEVINSGLITRALYINEGVEDDIKYSLTDEYEYLIKLSDNKRNEIKQEYRKLNKKINPLVIIQFPNSSDRLIKLVEDKLNEMGFSYKNKRLAKWMDNDKENVENIEENNGEPVFLLMKQAVSTGWDCPRAKVLVKLRENMNEDFEIQTIGRLRRMPEAQHYDNNILDYCYLYTFDEKYKEKVLNDGNAFEIKRVHLKEKCNKFRLIKETRDLDFEMIGEKETLIKAYEYLKKKYNLSDNLDNNEKIFNNNGFIIGEYLINKVPHGKVIKTSDIISKTKESYKEIKFEVNTHKNGIELLHSIDSIKKEIGISSQKVRTILKHLFHKKTKSKYKLLRLSNREWYAFIINNEEVIKNDFIDMSVDQARQLQVNLVPKTSEFSLPKEELYKFDSDTMDVNEMLSNAYEDYDTSMIVEGIRSKSERLFEYYCDRNENVEWIYKNGDKGLQYFSIVYTTSFMKQQLFYPDYIVKLKNGETWIIETKGGELNGQDKNIDKFVRSKFEAFRNYASKYNVNWAFVRDTNDILKYNNTNYVDDLQDKSWKPMDWIFGGH